MQPESAIIFLSAITSTAAEYLVCILLIAIVLHVNLRLYVILTICYHSDPPVANEWVAPFILLYLVASPYALDF